MSLGIHCELWITESLGLPYRNVGMYSVISVGELPNLSGPILTNRFSLRNLFFLRIDLPKNGIAARIGRKSREFQCESERRRDSRESGQVLQKKVSFCESIRANLRNVGMRIACPLSTEPKLFWN